MTAEGMLDAAVARVCQDTLHQRSNEILHVRHRVDFLYQIRYLLVKQYTTTSWLHNHFIAIYRPRAGARVTPYGCLAHFC